MIEEGEQAPAFELLGVRDGEFEEVTLSSYLGDGIVILAFYPGDFNPACTDDRTGLDELDLFTMQKDVTILGLSGDSVYSHRAFAEEYDLHVPLLSDTYGEVAGAYGVTVDDENAGRLTRRAVVVVGPTGTVEYTWIADDIETLPDVDEIRSVVDEIGGDDTALARYRVGYAHYIEGRRAFTSAMGAFEGKDWMLAKGDFDRAETEFGKARDEFNTAVRFSEDAQARPHLERAERKAESLWRASGWLGDAANEFASGEGAKGDSMRRDAQTPLETAKGIDEPPAPDEFPSDGGSTQSTDERDASLDVAPDPAEPANGAEGDAAADATSTADAAEGEPTPSGEETATAGTTMSAADSDDEQVSESTEEAAADGADGIDEAELEEIAAELEEQTEAARREQTAADSLDGGNVVPSSIDVDAEEGDAGDTDPADSEETETDGTASADEETGEQLELDLADPTEETGETDGGEDGDDTDTGRRNP